MQISAITVPCGVKPDENRTLDTWVEFAGGAAAVFWLYSDAVTFAEAAVRACPGTSYTVHNGRDEPMLIDADYVAREDAARAAAGECECDERQLDQVGCECGHDELLAEAGQ